MKDEETMSPFVIGVWTGYPLFGVVLQVGHHLRGGVVRKTLSNQRCHTGHMGRRLAGATEGRAARRSLPAVGGDPIRLGPPVRSGPSAAEVGKQRFTFVPGGGATASIPGLALSAGLMMLPAPAEFSARRVGHHPTS